jgi:hypothetical protein
MLWIPADNSAPFGSKRIKMDKGKKKKPSAWYFIFRSFLKASTG